MTEDRKRLVPKAANNPLPFAILGYLTIFAMFGMLGAWAALAHLDSAVVAVGQVAPESNRKEVQHYEGGIVSEIFVKEADVVKQGDLLMRLAGTQASANAETVQSQLDAAIALEARLTAERERADHITFPSEIESRRANPTTAKLIADQIAQFEERRQSLKSQRDILGSRVEQLEREIVGLRAVVDSTKGQIASLVTEIDKVKLLAKRGLFPQNRMHAMERDLLADQGRLGQTEAEIAKNEQAIGETRLQIIQIEQKFLEDVVEQLRDVRVQVAELTEKGRVAADILSRIEIRAPQSGTVQSLRFHTRGGVVRAGETIIRPTTAYRTNPRRIQ